MMADSSESLAAITMVVNVEGMINCIDQPPPGYVGSQVRGSRLASVADGARC
jgi:hypothetical protein